MYSWKLSNKFRFGRSKDKEDRHGRHAEDTEPEESPGRVSADRKATIVPGSATVVQSRASTDIRTVSDSRSSMSGENKSGIGKHLNESFESTDVSRDDLAYEGSSSSQVNQPVLSHPESQEPQTHTSSGILTVKVYGGDSFKLPLPISYNEQVLSKLLSSGVDVTTTTTQDSLEELLQSMHGLSLVQEEDKVLSGEDASHFIPASVILPGSKNLNSLLYFTIEFDNTIATIEPESGTLNKPIFNKISTFDVTRKLACLSENRCFCQNPFDSTTISELAGFSCRFRRHVDRLHPKDKKQQRYSPRFVPFAIELENRLRLEHQIVQPSMDRAGW